MDRRAVCTFLTSNSATSSADARFDFDTGETDQVVRVCKNVADIYILNDFWTLAHTNTSLYE